MDQRFYPLTAVCFDLDQTLWRDTPEIVCALRYELYEVITRSTGMTFEEARTAFEENFSGLGSTSKTLAKFGVPSPEEAVRDCLDRADVAQYLQKDERLCALLLNIKRSRQDKPALYLITDSRRHTALRKLNALGITSAFDDMFCWDTHEANKTNRAVFPYIQQRHAAAASQLLMIGNSEIDDILPPYQQGWKTIHLAQEPSPKATAGISTIYDLERLLL